jgi:hypothetical protein
MNVSVGVPVTVHLLPACRAVQADLFERIVLAHHGTDLTEKSFCRERERAPFIGEKP